MEFGPNDNRGKAHRFTIKCIFPASKWVIEDYEGYLKLAHFLFDHVTLFQISPFFMMKKLQISTFFPFSNNFFPICANLRFFHYKKGLIWKSITWSEKNRNMKENLKGKINVLIWNKVTWSNKKWANLRYPVYCTFPYEAD